MSITCTIDVNNVYFQIYFLLSIVLTTNSANKLCCLVTNFQFSVKFIFIFDVTYLGIYFVHVLDIHHSQVFLKIPMNLHKNWLLLYLIQKVHLSELLSWLMTMVQDRPPVSRCWRLKAAPLFLVLYFVFYHI